MKDNFSKRSKLYSQYRPTYPKELFDFLLSIVPNRLSAWDCGTGNGQVATELGNYFKEVYATDISEKQLANAVLKSNIYYKREAAEKTSFTNEQFDLITVAQAIHWFNFETFYKEVNRTLKPNGIIVIIGYPLLKIDEDTDNIISHFYHNIVGPYWDKERKYLDEHYKTIPFPFNEISHPSISMKYDWSLNELIGYLTTWSAVQHYISKNNNNPVELIAKELEKSFTGSITKTVVFPILLRIGSKT